MENSVGTPEKSRSPSTSSKVTLYTLKRRASGTTHGSSDSQSNGVARTRADSEGEGNTSACKQLRMWYQTVAQSSGNVENLENLWHYRRRSGSPEILYVLRPSGSSTPNESPSSRSPPPPLSRPPSQSQQRPQQRKGHNSKTSTAAERIACLRRVVGHPTIQRFARERQRKHGLNEDHAHKQSTNENVSNTRGESRRDYHDSLDAILVNLQGTRMQLEQQESAAAAEASRARKRRMLPRPKSAAKGGRQHSQSKKLAIRVLQDCSCCDAVAQKVDGVTMVNNNAAAVAASMPSTDCCAPTGNIKSPGRTPSSHYHEVLRRLREEVLEEGVGGRPVTPEAGAPRLATAHSNTHAGAATAAGRPRTRLGVKLRFQRFQQERAHVEVSSEAAKESNEADVKLNDATSGLPAVGVPLSEYNWIAARNHGAATSPLFAGDHRPMTAVPRSRTAREVRRSSISSSVATTTTEEGGESIFLSSLHMHIQEQYPQGMVSSSPLSSQHTPTTAAAAAAALGRMVASYSWDTDSEYTTHGTRSGPSSYADVDMDVVVIRQPRKGVDRELVGKAGFAPSQMLREDIIMPGSSVKSDQLVKDSRSTTCKAGTGAGLRPGSRARGHVPISRAEDGTSSPSSSLARGANHHSTTWSIVTDASKEEGSDAEEMRAAAAASNAVSNNKDTCDTTTKREHHRAEVVREAMLDILPLPLPLTNTTATTTTPVGRVDTAATANGECAQDSSTSITASTVSESSTINSKSSTEPHQSDVDEHAEDGVATISSLAAHGTAENANGDAPEELQKQTTSDKRYLAPHSSVTFPPSSQPHQSGVVLAVSDEGSNCSDEDEAAAPATHGNGGDDAVRLEVMEKIPVLPTNTTVHSINVIDIYVDSTPFANSQDEHGAEEQQEDKEEQNREGALLEGVSSSSAAPPVSLSQTSLTEATHSSLAPLSVEKKNENSTSSSSSSSSEGVQRRSSNSQYLVLERERMASPALRGPRPPASPRRSSTSHMNGITGNKCHRQQPFAIRAEHSQFFNSASPRAQRSVDQDCRTGGSSTTAAAQVAAAMDAVGVIPLYNLPLSGAPSNIATPYSAISAPSAVSPTRCVGGGKVTSASGCGVGSIRPSRPGSAPLPQSLVRGQYRVINNYHSSLGDSLRRSLQSSDAFGWDKSTPSSRADDVTSFFSTSLSTIVTSASAMPSNGREWRRNTSLPGNFHSAVLAGQRGKMLSLNHHITHR